MVEGRGGGKQLKTRQSGSRAPTSRQIHAPKDAPRGLPPPASPYLSTVTTQLIPLRDNALIRLNSHNPIILPLNFLPLSHTWASGVMWHLTYTSPLSASGSPAHPCQRSPQPPVASVTSFVQGTQEHPAQRVTEKVRQSLVYKLCPYSYLLYTNSGVSPVWTPAHRGLWP